jgi:apyrase
MLHRAQVTPGISSFEAHPENAGTSLTKLLERAEQVVPTSEHANTLVLLRATAGMRLLTRRRAQRIYNSLYDAVLARGSFRPQREDFGTLSGEDEGVFGWLSANYLLRRSGRIGDAELGSVGALDLGGGSTQITLRTSPHASDGSQIDPRSASELRAPTATRAPRVPLPTGDVSVFSRSHLGWGNKAVLAALASHEAASCLAAGANASWEPSNKSSDYAQFLNRRAGEESYMLAGRGDFDACDAAIRRVIGSFDRSGQPPLQVHPPSLFVAMSLFFYVEHFIEVGGYMQPAKAAALAGGAAAPQRVSPAQLHHAARKLCSEPDASLHRLLGKDPLTTEDALRWRCFDAVYASRLLTHGYGFGEDDAVIEFLGEVDGVEVEWTLGALLHRILHGVGSNHGAPGGSGLTFPRGSGAPGSSSMVGGDATATHAPGGLIGTTMLGVLALGGVGGCLALLALRRGLGSGGRVRVATRDDKDWV